MKEYLRVSGRLKNSDLSEMRKHPMVLPTKHNFTVIVINHFNVLYFHAGAETTLSLIRSTTVNDLTSAAFIATLK
ncbi:hypothetical protein X975_08903, partial [Stegodyphus mimosarum]